MAERLEQIRLWTELLKTSYDIYPRRHFDLSNYHELLGFLDDNQRRRSSVRLESSLFTNYYDILRQINDYESESETTDVRPTPAPAQSQPTSAVSSLLASSPYVAPAPAVQIGQSVIPTSSKLATTFAAAVQSQPHNLGSVVVPKTASQLAPITPKHTKTKSAPTFVKSAVALASSWSGQIRQKIQKHKGKIQTAAKDASKRLTVGNRYATIDDFDSTDDLLIDTDGFVMEVKKNPSSAIPGPRISTPKPLTPQTGIKYIRLVRLLPFDHIYWLDGAAGKPMLYKNIRAVRLAPYNTIKLYVDQMDRIDVTRVNADGNDIKFPDSKVILDDIRLQSNL